MAKKNAKSQDTPVNVVVEDLSGSDKEFITKNYGKMTVEQLAEQTLKPVQAITDYVHNVDKNVKANKKPNKYGAVKGEAVVMDESMSVRGDKFAQQNPNPDFKKLYSGDLVTLKFKDDEKSE